MNEGIKAFARLLKDKIVFTQELSRYEVVAVWETIDEVLAELELKGTDIAKEKKPKLRMTKEALGIK